MANEDLFNDPELLAIKRCMREAIRDRLMTTPDADPFEALDDFQVFSEAYRRALRMKIARRDRAS